MTANARDFARVIERAKDDVLAERLLRAKQALAEAALTRIVARTPVDTGHARANWQVTIGRPATDVVAGTDPTGAKTVARGKATIRADRDPFATVWISNNAPGIRALEEGTATRPPAAMVALTVAELRRGR